MTLGIPAIRRLNRQIVIVVDMAVRAAGYLARRRQLVRARQGKSGGRMIKIRREPGNRIVASGTGRNRKHRGCRRMLGIGRLLPSREMATRVAAIRGLNLQVVVAPHVAIRAGNIGVAVGQREIDRRGGVIDGRAQPTVKRVTSFAGLRELRGNVIRIRRFLEIRLVTRDAGGGQALELADCGALVAVFALNGGVRAQQRETVLVILYLLDGNVPALNGVALGAVRAHLALVNIGVAILTVFPDVGEDRLDVALHALDFFVHPTQGIFGLVVIEFGNGADGLPARSGVAIFARNCQGAVRTTGVAALIGGLRSACGRPGEKNQPTQDVKTPGRNAPSTKESLDRLPGWGYGTESRVYIFDSPKDRFNCTSVQFWARDRLLSEASNPCAGPGRRMKH